LSFLLSTMFLTWVIGKLELQGWRQGMVLGGLVGFAIWVSLSIGLYSISTAPLSLLFGWAVGQSLEMAYAGAIIGQGLQVNKTRRLVITILLLTVGLVVLTFILQSVGLATAVVIS
ncbi:MAG: hypothetical protein WBR18_03265, partial [Anaerolineales bacterium]